MPCKNRSVSLKLEILKEIIGGTELIQSILSVLMLCHLQSLYHWLNRARPWSKDNDMSEF